MKQKNFLWNARRSRGSTWGAGVVPVAAGRSPGPWRRPRWQQEEAVVFLTLLPDMRAVTADSDEQAYYFISKDEKNMVGSLFSLRSCSFIMLAACLREKLLHAWAHRPARSCSARAWEEASSWSSGTRGRGGTGLDGKWGGWERG